jgi:hypothetical protein
MSRIPHGADCANLLRNIAILDDQLRRRVQMLDEGREDIGAPYRQLAQAVIVRTLTDVTRLAQTNPTWALALVDRLAASPDWQVWCEVVGVDVQMLRNRLRTHMGAVRPFHLDTRLPQPDAVFDDTTPPDTAMHMRDP